MESDRKLRTLSLLKYSCISVTEIDETVKSGESSKSYVEIIAKAESLYGDLQLNIIPTDDDLIVICYVTGYCCRSLIRSTRCEQCKEVTVGDVSEPDANAIPENASKFFREINRGGLWQPTTDFFNVGCLCWRVFAEMCQGQIREKFLCSANQRGIFAEIVTMAFYEGKIICP